jgi:hypothetical protein
MQRLPLLRRRRTIAKIALRREEPRRLAKALTYLEARQVALPIWVNAYKV